MTTPVFGHCKYCKAATKNGYELPAFDLTCTRHPSNIDVRIDHGCFDFIPKEREEAPDK